MEIIHNKISLCEKTAQNRNTVKSAIIMVSRYYSSYLLGNEKNLQKAYYVAVKAYKINPSNIDLFLYTIFLNIEMQNTDIASDMLNAFKPYYGYYKNKKLKIYAKYLFLLILLELNNKKSKKYLNILIQLSKKEDSYFYYELLGYIYIKLNNKSNAYTYLESAFKKGSRSIYTFLGFYEISKLNGKCFKSDILLSFLRWANRNQIINKYILDKNKDIIIPLVYRNLSLFKSIYMNIDIEWLLIEICRTLQRKKDYSISSYKFYKEAERKQIYIQEFNEILMISSSINGIEELSRYSMEFYIQNNNLNININIKPFIYHLLITNKKLNNLISIYNMKEYIINFAISSIKLNLTGRYFNSIYRYALEHLKDVNEDVANLIEKHLYNNLFIYKLVVSNPLVGYVWVNETEKRESNVYKVENGSCKIKVCTNYFRSVYLDKKQKNIIENETTLIRQIENEDIWLYKYFLDKGYEDLEIFIALSAYHIKSSKLDVDAISILNKTISFKEISQTFRMQINAVLGNALFLQNRYDKALKYYNEVDNYNLNEKYIEIMLNVFINTNEYDKAIKLILKKSTYITEKSLFNALKRLSKYEKYHTIIVGYVYQFLVKGWYDRSLLDIVLKYYNGSQEEWQRLSTSLNNMSIIEIRIDEIILENSIWTHNFNIASQLVFLRMYNTCPLNLLIDKFVYYTCYEVLINFVKLEHEMIIALENIYEEKKDVLLGYALSNIYSRYNINSDKSYKILKDTISHMEKHSIILPSIKQIKDKNILTSYIEKSESFIYKCAPGKKVYIYYKFENDREFRQSPMKYIKFGVYMYVIPIFYNEVIRYYFLEDDGQNSIITNEYTTINSKAYIKENTGDKFFEINNALIYEQMFKYNEVENIATRLVKPIDTIMGKIM